MKENAKRDRARSRVVILGELVARYPIVSIEDGMAEDDLGGLEGAHRSDRRDDVSSWATICLSPTWTG